MTDDRISQLRQRGQKRATDKSGSGDRPDQWKPDNAGEFLAGTITDARYVHSKYTNGPQPVLEIKDETGKDWTVFASSGMLADEVLGKAPGPGTVIVIEYHGTERTKSGYDMKLFTVECDPAVPDHNHWKNELAAYDHRNEMFLRRQQQQPASASRQVSQPPAGFAAPDEAPF